MCARERWNLRMQRDPRGHGRMHTHTSLLAAGITAVRNTQDPARPAKRRRWRTHAGRRETSLGTRPRAQPASRPRPARPL
jgi:hypothetical protein